MGNGVSIQCKKCDYSTTLFEGLGSRTQDFEVFRRELTKKENEIIDLIINNNNINKIFHYNVYTKCEKCGDLSTVPYVEINYDNNKVFKLDYECKLCKGKCNLISEEEVINSKCPICNYEHLQSVRNIFWD